MNSKAPKPGQLHDSWQQLLAAELESDYMQQLRSFLRQEKQQHKQIYPPGPEIFNAFNFTPFEQLKVVILGQDPYHGPGQAHGLCVSVKPGTQTPPSLINIFKEIHQDLGLEPPKHGYLEHWARQGVLLLNSVLSVERGRAGTHQNQGWEQFTDAVIDVINQKSSSIVFMLWGSYAQKKGRLIDRQRHFVLQSPHPSPLSAHRGFFGSGHFSKANQYLTDNNSDPIDWGLPELQA